MIRKNLLFAVSALALISFSSVATAAEKMSMEEIQAQLQQLSAQVQHLTTVVEQQNQVIKKQDAELEAQKQASAQAIEDAVAGIQPAAGGGAGNVKISMKPGPKIESSDGKHSMQLFGRVHLDATHFDDDKFDHPSNANFRRARLGIKGNLGEDFEYKSEIDFGEEAVNFKEVTLTYTGLNAADIKIGHHKPAFGMEQNTSSNYMMFIERAAPTNAFSRDEEIGLNIIGGGDNWTLAGGVFNQDAATSAGDPDEDITFDTRGTMNVLGFGNNVGDNVLHVGAGYSHRKPESAVTFAAAPAGEGPALVSTGAISATEHVDVYNAELAAIFGPVTFQGEYFNADVSRDNGNADVDLDGYYAQAGWFLTGEQRPYKKGTFKRVKPKSPFSLKNGGWGAWEVLARYENADLNDAGAGITGGELDNITLGLNWHLTDYIRLMVNVTDVDTDANAATAADDDPTIYNFRTQWDF